MSFIKGVLTGLAIGYLTAPRSGKETRDKLTSNAKDWQGQINDGIDQVKSQVDQLTGQAKSTINEYKSKAENTYDQYKNDAASTYNKQQMKSDYNDAVGDTADAAKSGINQTEDAFKVN